MNVELIKNVVKSFHSRERVFQKQKEIHKTLALMKLLQRKFPNIDFLRQFTWVFKNVVVFIGQCEGIHCLYYLFFTSPFSWDSHCLALDLGDAVLEYRLKDPNIIEMYHTEVPKAYRGQGIAKKLVAVSELCLSRIYEEYLSKNLLKIKPHVSSRFNIVLHPSYL